MAVILHRNEKIAKKYLKCAPETKSPRKNGVSEKIKSFREKVLLFPELRHNTVYDLDEIIQNPINRGMEEENK